MKKFIVHQNYTTQGTNYFEVEANTLEEAKEKVENFEVEKYTSDIWDCDYDLEGFELEEGK
jgi:hypothetical protein